MPLLRQKKTNLVTTSTYQYLGMGKGRKKRNQNNVSKVQNVAQRLLKTKAFDDPFTVLTVQRHVAPAAAQCKS